jgi:hypothetical protein
MRALSHEIFLVFGHSALLTLGDPLRLTPKDSMEPFI